VTSIADSGCHVVSDLVPSLYESDWRTTSEVRRGVGWERRSRIYITGQRLQATGYNMTGSKERAQRLPMSWQAMGRYTAGMT
jgi:hypothetical protein